LEIPETRLKLRENQNIQSQTLGTLQITYNSKLNNQQELL